MELKISKPDQFTHSCSQLYKHITFNRGQCIGHIEPYIDHMPQTSINSLTTQKMIDEHIQPNTFTPTLHTLPGDVRKSLNQFLEVFQLQFAQDEISMTQHISQNWKLTQVTKNLSLRGYTPLP